MQPSAGVVVGAGGHALVVIEVLREMGLEVAGCVSTDGTAAADLDTLDVPMLGRVDELEQLLEPERWAFVAVGDNEARRTLSEMLLSRSVELVPAISPRSVVSRSASVGAGALVMPGAVINSGARLAIGAIANTGATIDHECVIHEFAHVAPGVHLAGRVTVGAGTLIGIGASVVPDRTIGAAAVIGAGAVVLDDVDDGDTVVGVPARVISPSAPDVPAASDDARVRVDEIDRPTGDDIGDEVDDQRVPRILVVCTGNLNRSPLAEALLRRELQRIGVEADVSSAGLAAPIGSHVDNKLRRVANELGVGDEIDAHRSVQVGPGQLYGVDLIVAMTREQVDELERYGSVGRRAVTLRAAAWRSRVIGRQQLGFDEWVERLTAVLPESIGSNGLAAEDIADPIGGRLKQYRAMGAEVSELVSTLVDHWGGR